MTINILFVTASPGHVFGGGKQAFCSLISRLDRRRFNPLVAAAPTGRYADMMRSLGVRLIPVAMNNRFDMRIPYRLARAIREHAVTIVHSHGGGRADFFVYLTSKFVNVPVKITTVANLVERWFEVNPLQLYLYKKIQKRTEKVFNQFVCVSDYLADHLIHEHGLEKVRVKTIYNGIDLDYFNASRDYPRARNEFSREGEQILIGAIGRLVAEKGLEYLLKAIPEVLQRFAQVKLLLVGDGPLKAHLERRVRSLGLRDKVVFTGFRTDIRGILSCLDIFILPSLLEGFPMSILEAMAMARPIVASDIPGIREQIIHGQNGMLVPPKDSTALASAIIKMLADKNAAENIGLAARKTVEQKFAIENMIAETERLYLSLLEAQ